jgi:hypothetical protein
MIQIEERLSGEHAEGFLKVEHEGIFRQDDRINRMTEQKRASSLRLPHIL